MRLKTTFLCILIFVAFSISNCKSPAKIYESVSMDFIIPDFYGKWTSDGKVYSSTLVVFNNDHTFYDENGKRGTFTIKEDKIEMILGEHIYTGRLLVQTKDQLKILWGKKQVTSYNRPAD